MRPAKLISVLAAIAALLALSATGASARRAAGVPRSHGPCRIHLEVPAVITEGEATTIFGSLACPKKPEEAGGKHVSVFRRSAGNAGFTLVGEATTETSGAFKITPPVFDTNTAFFAVSQGARSAHEMVKVAVQINPATPPTPAEGAQLFAGGNAVRRHQDQVTFAGTVKRSEAGAGVALQRENATSSEEWHLIQLGKVNGNGEYSITHDFVVPGDASLRVVVRPLPGNVAAATTPLSYEISQVENQALTIEGTADPLTFGQPVTIKGVVRGAKSGTPLTLLSHGRGGQYAPAGTTSTSGPGGAYEFSSQTPAQNMFYKVTDAENGTQSSQLFEGVKYALNVNPPPSTTQAGQSVTLSGTVLPAVAGHRVYLERQGSLKLGWHVIETGTVSAPANQGEPGTFSIAHTFYEAGTNPRLRIKIPGDPGNEGAAAPAFELSVTPGPASALRPQAPGGSKLPGEGQF